MAQEVSLPVAIGGVAEDAPEGISLEKYAAIGAHLALRTWEPRAVVLGQFELDEQRWSAVQKVWSDRIEAEVMRGSAPGLRPRSEDRYILSLRYAVAYAEAAQRIRNGSGSAKAHPAARS